MKTCISCQYLKKQAMQVSPTQMGMGYICGHEECVDPVDGSPIPAGLARREIVFCSFTAKYWKAKEQEPTPESPNVIQLAK